MLLFRIAFFIVQCLMRMRESLFTISCACVTLLWCAVCLYIGSGLWSEKCYNQGGWLFDFTTVSEGRRPCSKLVDFLGWFSQIFYKISFADFVRYSLRSFSVHLLSVAFLTHVNKFRVHKNSYLRIFTYKLQLLLEKTQFPHAISPIGKVPYFVSFCFVICR
jgi:hypothetical protein